MMDRIETNSSRVAFIEAHADPSPMRSAREPSRVRGITIAAVLACLGGMAAFVWVADQLWGSVAMGVLLVLSLTAAFALPELMLIAFAHWQSEAELHDGSGDAN